MIRKIFVLLLMASLIGCGSDRPSSKNRAPRSNFYSNSNYSEGYSKDYSEKPQSSEFLPGFDQDNMIEALPALVSSCRVMMKKDIKWIPFCEDFLSIDFESSDELREFIRENMKAVLQKGMGAFTGYYRPMIDGSLTRTSRFNVPVYARPKDLGTSKYLTREQINKSTHLKALVYIEHKADLFFLQIQGSGLIRLPDDTELSLSFDGSNNRPFYAIGQDLKKLGIHKAQDIREWLIENPYEGEKLMNKNERYIFFKATEVTGAIGSMGVALTPMRSLAVDPNYIPMGSFMWLDTTGPDGQPLQRLMSAQDTGAAIKGPVRGDFFWGTGKGALHYAGRMHSRGKYYILIPKDF
ncbi:MAG: MltA domain-containing protein [Alphaproteobacteria bacterium]|nr:MltA domain-containing protein [Alphaproteobacteria bacterium]